MKRILVLLVVVILFAGGTGYFWHKYTIFSKDPAEVTREQVKELVAQISQFMVLPDGEIPTVATVSDVSKLQGQPFFEKAKQGDKVLIYSGARKAILYDPIARKIVEVAPVNLNGQVLPNK